jgi:hypothetical protein
MRMPGGSWHAGVVLRCAADRAELEAGLQLAQCDGPAGRGVQYNCGTYL